MTNGPQSPEGGNPGLHVEDILRLAVGPEADYYLQEMREQAADRFAVIKVGGDTVKNDLESLSSDIAMLAKLGLYPVVVHGGGPQINAELEARGIEEKRHNGLRVTDEATLESVEQGLGQVNETLVEALKSKGVVAEPVTSGVFTAHYKNKASLGFVGEVDTVDPAQIQQAIAAGKVPIVSCLGQATDGQPLNINGDVAARALGATLQPDKFIMLTNVPGVLDEDKQVISVLNDTQHIDALIEDGTISAGMIPKVESAMGVLRELPQDSSVVITNPQQLVRELFTHEGGGTLLRHGDAITHLPSVEAVDQEAVRGLIETSFGKQLVDNYFETLPEEAEIFITDRGYRGLAIVLPSEHGPAYLDKLAVRPEYGGQGIGDEIVDKVLESHPEGVYWRVRKDNKSLEWYRSRGRGQEYDMGDDEWLVFFTKEVKSDDRARYAAQAILKEQTVFIDQSKN